MIGTMTLSMLVEELDGELHGEDAELSRISTDTRSLVEGDVYLALVGDNFDGNEFTSQAARLGASGAIVSREASSDIPELRVADTHVALGKIASINRKRSQAKVIALTGSQGKTTVKEMIGAILDVRGVALVTEANLNNTIGVPLTLLRITEEHTSVVVELGASSAGEIAYSVAITAPDIALITNASAAHIEGFGSLRGIVAAKGEIIAGLQDDGVLILNADDEHVADWMLMAGRRKTVRFGYSACSEGAEYFSDAVSMNKQAEVSFILHSPLGERKLSINFLGKHNVVNALAAAAAAIEAGANLDDVEQGLTKLQPVRGRLYPLSGIKGSRLIDDSYNASPSSFFAAIDVLVSCSGRRLLLAGEMRELGGESASAHVAVGRYAAVSGVDELWATGHQCQQMIDAFNSEGGDDRGKYFATKADMTDACKKAANSDLVFMVKGSRGAEMETIVNALNRTSKSGGGEI